MDVVHGFWAGALRLAGRFDLDALAERFGGWAGLARASVGDLCDQGIPPEVARGWLNEPTLETRGRALTRCCDDFPPALRLIPRGPPVVFVEGDPQALRLPAIAVVGTRSCTPYGTRIASQVAGEAARAGFVVVSGLARGIDSHAHQAALLRGRTIAVLGHGLDFTSPTSNRRLRADLLAAGGMVLTSWPDATPPAPWTFPLRNRWIAALSRKVVVVEAPVRSGALLTAVHLTELGRQEDLWVAPGPLGSPTWQGSAELITLGCNALVDLDAFFTGLGATPGLRHPDWLSALLDGAPLHEVAELRGTSSIELLRELTLLELHGHLIRLPGGRFASGGGLP